MGITINKKYFFCLINREDISFHFSLGFTALMRRFTGNKSLNTNKMFATNIFNSSNSLKPNKSETFSSSNEYQKELQSRSYNSEANLTTASNLNPFSIQNDQANNLLILLQGFQMVASRSNVVLFAVDGIVRNIFGL